MTTSAADHATILLRTAEAVLHFTGEPSSTALAEQLVRRIDAADEAVITAFLRHLLERFGPDEARLKAAVDAWQATPNAETAQALGDAAEASRQELFRVMNTAPGGIGCLLSLRTAAVQRRADHPELRPVERDLEHLLRSWFNRGFLELRRLDWETPAHILEKLIEYEAVHEISGWHDLRRRLEEDRRSFGFFHPSLPGEPIIFVEVALTSGMSRSIQNVLAPRDPAMTSVPDTAIFYSITNCQTGLRGISFGNFLIKQVTALLRAELPELETFATLSPIPGFGRWLADAEPAIDTSDQAAMERACARYLCVERRHGRPLDPVARFHLRNGARVERINWKGDTSAKGMAESHGLLVNYRYSGQDLEANHEALENDGVVIAAPEIIALLDDPGSVAAEPPPAG